jgi:hypothetical protein
MLKRIALLGAIAAVLTLANPSNSVAQGWDGSGGGITVSIGNLLGFHVGFPFPNRRADFCCERRERRFFPRRVDCCEERRFFPRRIDCCEERRFFPSQVDCCEEQRDFCCDERRFFARPVFCCDDRRFFPRPFGRPPYYYGDRFAPSVYNWNSGYTNVGYGAGYPDAGYGYY